MKQQDPKAHSKLRYASRGSSGGKGSSPVKRKPFIASGLSSSSQSESESRPNSEDEGSTGDDRMADSEDETGTWGPDGPTFNDIKEITTRRSKLAKWFMEPFFEELIVGCFVRVGIGRSKSGPIYRLFMVRNVDATDPDRTYKLENRATYKYLNVVWGNESSAARWQMDIISDSPPQEEEFRQWVREVERSGCRMPSKQDVLEKKEALQKVRTFVYSAATVKQMLQEKKSSSSKHLNVAAEKDRLRRDLEIAQSKHDEADVERIKKRLHQLEASRQSQEKDVKAIRLAEMNRKNRVENFKNASGLKPVNTSFKAGEAGYDPFSRRWTRSRNYYNAKAPGGDTTAATNDDTNGNGNANAITESNGRQMAKAENPNGVQA
ncbi:protein RTF1 homolog [Hibiscus syriacus]|uniref:protein RTF1 homolog n=1 Tax=Hibiscus syriacus TaxID=106335 RepID=UPI0019212823|nr:protein RTF1 homolog [Hibiscus syriacus]